MECFRPFVKSQQWDYIVLWKLGNDPTRFIEWKECCCSGGCEIVKEEKNDESLPLCRDVSLKHSVRTKACESLSHFPSSIDLYSGIHSEVVISRQPSWINQDGIGTRAFFPIESGLIEFYSTKNIPKEQRILDKIMAHCKMVSIDQKVSSPLDPLPKRGSRLNHSSDRLKLFDDSNADQIQFDKETSRRQECSILLGCESVKKSTKRKENGEYQSKNLVAERERRKKIKNGLLTLRSLVPNITKMDMASILRDAVKYIEDLQIEEKGLRKKLGEIEDREKEHKRRESKGGVVVVPYSSSSKKPEAKVQVNQIDEREFFVKLFAPHKLGGFVRLLEALESFKLEVICANSTTLNQGVLNVLQLKADKDIEPKRLRDFFTKLSG